MKAIISFLVLFCSCHEVLSAQRRASLKQPGESSKPRVVAVRSPEASFEVDSADEARVTEILLEPEQFGHDGAVVEGQSMEASPLSGIGRRSKYGHRSLDEAINLSKQQLKTCTMEEMGTWLKEMKFIVDAIKKSQDDFVENIDKTKAELLLSRDEFAAKMHLFLKEAESKRIALEHQQTERFAFLEKGQQETLMRLEKEQTEKLETLLKAIGSRNFIITSCEVIKTSTLVATVAFWYRHLVKCGLIW